MDAIDIVARLIGAFYIFGGWAGLRAAARDALLDKALAALTLKPPHPDEAIRRNIMIFGTLLTAVSGGALALLAGIAPWLFLANLAFQAGWLVYARKRFPPQDEEEALGRRQVARASVIWAVLTAMVLWLDYDGRLGSPLALWPPLVLLAGAAAMLFWIGRHLMWNPAQAPSFDFDDEQEAEPIVHPTRVKLALRYGYQTLWDADTGRGVNPYDHLPHELAMRLLSWEDAFHLAVDPHDPSGGPDFTPEEAAAHAAEGEAIAEALRHIFGPDSVEGPIVEQDGELSAG